jgi:DNA mismatch endonuclease (patch repair protein)
MADRISSAQRSENMRRIKSANTDPEMVIRRVVHSMGYRYRLHRKELPGKPDLVFGSRRKVIFVHGCFWHQHRDCSAGRIPSSNIEYWGPKLRRNTERDQAARSALEASGWQVLVIWGCEARDDDSMRRRLSEFLSGAQ